MLNLRDPIHDLVYKNAVNIQNVAADGDIVGNVFDITLLPPYFGFIFKSGAYTTGKVKLKAIRFSDDITFATGVVELLAVDYLERFSNSDHTNGLNPVENATLDGANQIKRIGFSNAVPLKQYARIVLEGTNTSVMTISAEFVCENPYVTDKLLRQGL